MTVLLLLLLLLLLLFSPLELPLVESSTFSIDVYNLLSEINLPQSVSDVSFNVSYCLMEYIHT